MIEQFLRDVRCARRAIRRMPALAAVVIGSLGVGIGANTVVFSWIQAVVFNPVPGLRIASGLHLVEPKNDAGMYTGVSWPEYRDLREQLHSFDGLIAFRMIPLYVGDPGEVERASGLLVSDNYFATLGLKPALGRFLRADEVEQPGASPVLVISHDYWQTHFAGSPDVVGRIVRVNGVGLTIVGVAPQGFKGTVMRLTFDFWLPATLAPAVMPDSNELVDRAVRAYTVTGPLARGTSRAQAESDVNVVMRRLAEVYAKTNRAIRAEVLPFWQSPRGPQRLLASSLGVLQTIMLLLLLAVCGNTANLVLSRAAARQREVGVRLALGAGRWRIASLLLTESLLLAAAGAAVGAAIAWWGTGLLASMPPMRVRGIPISFETSLDGVSLAFASVLGLACAVIFGAAPALQLARLDPHATLRSGAATAPRSTLRNALMAIEVALAIVVLVAGGLFVRGFMATRLEDPGFRRDGVLLAEYDLSGRRLTDASVAAFTATLLERVGALPGVERAAIGLSVPLDIHGMPMRFFALDGRARSDDALDQALVNTVTPGYFAVMGLPLLAGRDFADLRDTAAPAQTIVNDAFTRRYLDGANPLGRRLEVRGRQYTIAGVVRTSLYNAFGEPPTPIIYFSYRDRPAAIGDLHVRARSGAEATLAADLRRVVRDLDAELPLYDVRTLSDHIESNLIFRRIPARMFSVLSPLLLLLAAIGIYAVVAYAVTLRTFEIGVRMALGATARRLVRSFVLEHLRVIVAGAAAGWVIAFAVAVNLLSASIDVTVFAGVPLLLFAVAIVAAWWPARRVARVDPMLALRE